MSKQTAVIELDRRQAILDNVNLRPENHGDDIVPAVDIKLSGIPLNKVELNTLLGDKHAHDCLFNTAKAGSIVEPMFKQFQAFKLKDKFEDCSATMSFGLAEDGYELDDVKITGVSLEPLAGGMTAMTVTLQHALEDTDIVGDLASYLRSECSIVLTFGTKAIEDKKAKEKQGKLPLNEGTDKPKGDEVASSTVQ